VDKPLPTTEFAQSGILSYLSRMMGWRCGHESYTVPMRLPGDRELTVSCLQCATRLRYDWDRMALAHRPSKSAAVSRQRGLLQLLSIHTRQ